MGIMCLEEIRLHAQCTITIIGSKVNIIGGGGLYDHLMSMIIFTLIMNKVFVRAPKMMRKVATTSI